MSSKSGAAKATRMLLGFMSLVPTPLLVFITSSTKLYARNHAKLHDQPEVLLPFIYLFLISLGVGLVVYLLSKHTAFRYTLWSYYLIGPLFLAFQFLRSATGNSTFLSWLAHTQAGVWALVLVFALAVIAAGRTLHLRSVVTPLALYAVLLLVNEARVIGGAVRGRAVEAPERASESPLANKLPNIYHIVLDGFQTDVFELVRSTETEKALGGFTYFPNNTAIYHLTATSLASTFGSSRYDYRRTRSEYLHEALNGKDSLIQRLKDRGYTAEVYIPALQETRFEIPDYVFRHADYVRADLLAMNTSSFTRLWVYSQAPRALRTRFSPAALDSADLKRLEEGRFLPYSSPAVSALGFGKLIKEEENLRASGRYSFIHLLMPHQPYVLRKDCSFDHAGAKTDLMAQTQCTLKLLFGFLDVLHTLGRFEDSLILVHGDHGGHYRMRDGKLIDYRSRSLRSLLLVKPVGRGPEDRFEVSPRKSSLLDIAPTILDCVGIDVSREFDAFEGNSLGDGVPCSD